MSKVPKMPNFWYYVIYYVSRIAYIICHPSKVIGLENVPTGGALVCGNHTGLSDPVMACHATTKRHPLQPMSKIEVTNIPILGKVLLTAGVIPVDRDNPDSKIMRHTLNCLKAGNKVLIYPEGTRRAPGEESINPKTGAAFFATRSGVPIIPMYIPREKPLFKRIPVFIGEPYIPEYAGKKATTEELETISSEIMKRIDAMRIPHEESLRK
ncbi:MAG: lysophospholipid acyltransferase family protein [Eubacteriales bacterium]